MFCIFHKWDKWEQYEVVHPEFRISKNYYLVESIEHRQKKKCLRCGKVKDEFISMSVGEMESK